MKRSQIERHEMREIPVTGSEEEKVEQENIVSKEKKSSYLENEPEYLVQLQRLQAEFQNYKRRVEKERESLFTFAKGDLVIKLLPIVDDFERVLDHPQIEDQNCLTGVRLVHKNLSKILSEEGLEHIPCTTVPFNPDLHEAVGVEETDEAHDGFVIEEWQKGYTFGGRLLRPSRVKVGKFPGKVGDD